MNKARSIATLTTESRVLCCNFVNTVYAWRGVNLHEYFGSYDDVISWCKKLAVFNDDYLHALSEMAARHPQKAVIALAQIKEARELLYLFTAAIAARDEAQYPGLLEKLAPFLSNALSKVRLTYRDHRFTEGYEYEPDLLSVLWPVMKSFYELLTGADLHRVRECPKCGWVFYDETRNGRRRWCSPTECGTQDKMMRYNQKRKLAGRSQ